jgi:hypothetical protein
MTRSARAVISLVVLLGACPCAANDLESITLQQRAIVRVDGASHGAGIVVVVEPQFVRIITARHVVEGSGKLAIGIPQSRRECSGEPPTITFQFELQATYPASSCMVTDRDDLALLDVPFDSRGRVIPTFKPPNPLLDLPPNQVYFLGRASGLSSGVVVLNDYASLDQQNVLMAQGRVESSFSGGAVLDVEGGLAGMIVAVSPTLTTSLRWTRIEEILGVWQIRTNRLEGSATEVPNPAFRLQVPHDFSVEGARNAVRLYRNALTRKNRDSLNFVYPTLGLPRIDALFGDALKIELGLRDCTDLDASNHLTCEYQLIVFRRTGSMVKVESKCYEPAAPGNPPCANLMNEEQPRSVGAPMTFTVKREQSEARWVIEDIERIK